MATEAEALTQKQRRRLAEFIAPFRVEPGTKVKLAKDFDPAFKAGVKKKKEGVALLNEGVRLLSEYQARLAAQDTLGRAGGAPGARRRGQGRDDPPRDERRQSRRASPSTASRSRRPRSSATTTCGATPSACPARGQIGIFNRSHYEEVLVVRVHPRTSSARSCPTAAKKGDVWKRRYREINDWERYLTDNGFRDRQAVPEPLQGGAAHPVPAPDRPARSQLEVLVGRRRASASTGTTTRRRSPRCSRTRAPSGRRGT